MSEPTKVIDLMVALKASIDEQARAGEIERRKGERRVEDRGFGQRAEYRDNPNMWGFVYRGSISDRRRPPHTRTER